MPLPIVVVPHFELIVPSTGKKVKCRPFLVKEEKILLMASESKDEKEILNSIKQILENCLIDKNNHNLDQLAMFDVEYLFLKIRARSKGEKIVLRFNGIEDSECEECKKPKTIEIDLNQLDVIRDPKHTKKIQLTETIAVEMAYPRISSIKNIDLKETTESLLLFDLIQTNIECIYDDKQIYYTKDFTHDELNSFLEGLTSEHLEKIVNFFLTMPRIEHSIDLSCSTCGRKDIQILNDLKSFFP